MRQLDALAEKLEGKKAIAGQVGEGQEEQLGDLAKATREAESTVQDWLTVLARCFQLQDAIVLELDRVLDGSPDELGRHRVGLRIARQNRRDLISRSTERLMARMDAAAGTAKAKTGPNQPSGKPRTVHKGP